MQAKGRMQPGRIADGSRVGRRVELPTGSFIGFRQREGPFLSIATLRCRPFGGFAISLLLSKPYGDSTSAACCVCHGISGLEVTASPLPVKNPSQGEPQLFDGTADRGYPLPLGDSGPWQLEIWVE